MTDPPTYGPAFSQLSAMRKKFVLAMMADPFGSHADWARAAGYSNKNNCARAQAHCLMQDAGIQAAALEVARGHFGTVGPLLASEVLLRVAADPQHPQQVRAAELIANRVGLHETQEIQVKHYDLTGDALLARLHAVAERLGLDAQQLIGSNAAGDGATVIEGEVSKAPPGSLENGPAATHK